MRVHGRARIDPSNPQRSAACQRCGTVYNRADLRPQMQWAGQGLVSTGFYVCPSCYDVPNPHERTLFLAADPPPAFGVLPIGFPMDDASEWIIGPPPGADMFPAWADMSATLEFIKQFLPSMSTTAAMAVAPAYGFQPNPSMSTTAGMSGVPAYGFQPSPAMATTAGMAAPLYRGVFEAASMSTVAGMTGVPAYGFQPSASMPATAAMAATPAYGYIGAHPSMATTAGMTGSTSLTHTIYVTATGAGSWSVPSGVTALTVQGIGGGGGGGTASGVSSAGGGGGGAYAAATVTVSAAQTIYYSVGTGGGAGSNGAELVAEHISQQRAWGFVERYCRKGWCGRRRWHHRRWRLRRKLCRVDGLFGRRQLRRRFDHRWRRCSRAIGDGRKWRL